MIPELPEICTPKEVSDFLRCGKHIILDAIKDGNLKAMKLTNKTYRIRRESVFDYMENVQCQSKTEDFRSNQEKTGEPGRSENTLREDGRGYQAGTKALRLLKKSGSLSKDDSAQVIPMRPTNA